MSYTDSQNIQYKASTGQVNLDQAQGIVECFVAGIGNKDSVGDVCATGAFAKSLLRRKPRVVWGHNWNDPIGKVLEMYEVPPNDPRLPAKMRSAGIGGLYAKVQFNLNSEKGKEAFANVAFFGEEQEWSIGYKTLRAQFDQGSQANILYEVELYEVSPVLHGANQLTGTISVKNADGNTPMVMPVMQGMPNMPEDEVQKKLQEELSLQTGSKVNISSVEDGEVTFTMGEKGEEESYKCHFRNDNGVFMFSNPQRINKPMQMPSQMQPMMPMGMPSRPMVPQNPNQTVVVPQVLPGGMSNQMPLIQIDYVEEDSSSKPQGKPKLVQEEADLAEALIKITKRHGKFNEDANGVWAGYKPAAENMVAKIGVKCSNCVMYEGNGVCKIIALKVEDGGKCRFAVIPEGVVKVSPIKKQEVTEEMQEEEVKWLKEIEDKYPEVFIKGDLRHAVKSKRDALTASVKLTRIEEYSVKSANNEIYYLPVTQKDAFEMKQAIDPIIDYYRAEAYVDDGGIVFTSGVNKDFAEAVNNAVKALGRNLAGRTARAGRGMAARFNPKAWDGDNDGLVQEGTPYQRPAIPGINDFGTRGVVDTTRATAAFKKPKGASKKPTPSRRGLSSGKRDLSRHSNRDRDLEKQFPNAEENAKREAHDKLIDAWEAGMNMSFTTIGRQQDERGGKFSEDFLRGRELGYNDARSRWFGKGTAEQPKDFNPKAKASGKYSSWYRNTVSQLGRGKANRPEDADREQQYAGIDAGMKDFLMSVAPDTSNWAEEDRASLAKLEKDYGLGRGGLSSGMGFDKFGNIPAKPKNNRRTVDPSLRNTSKNRAMMTAERRLEEMANSGDAEYDSLILRAREALSNEGVPGYRLTNEYGEPNSLVAQKMQEILASDIQRGGLSSGRRMSPEQLKERLKMVAALPDHRKDEDYIKLSDDDKKYADVIEKLISDGTITSNNSWYDYSSNSARDVMSDAEIYDAVYGGMPSEDELDSYASGVDFGFESSGSRGSERDYSPSSDEVEGEYISETIDEMTGEDFLTALKENMTPKQFEKAIRDYESGATRGIFVPVSDEKGWVDLAEEEAGNSPKALAYFLINRGVLEEDHPTIEKLKNNRTNDAEYEKAFEMLAEMDAERGGLSSGKKPTGEKLVVNSLGKDVPLAERLKEIDEFSTEDLGYEVYEVLTNTTSSVSDDFGWDYLERNHGVDKPDYKYRPGDFGYLSDNQPGYDIRQAIEDSMSEDEQRNFLKTSSKLEAAEDNRGGLSSGRGIDPSLGDPANITPEEAADRTDDIGANFRYLFVSPDAVAFKYNGKMREIRAESDNGIYDSLRRSKAGALYFGGIDSESGEYRTFRLDRIEGLIPGASRQSTSSGPYNRAGLSSGRRDLGKPFSSYEELSDDEQSDIEQAYFANNPGSERPGSRDYDSDAALNDFEINPEKYGYSANFRGDAVRELRKTGISRDDAEYITDYWIENDGIHDRYLRNANDDTLAAMNSAYDDYLDSPYSRNIRESFDRQFGSPEFPSVRRSLSSGRVIMSDGQDEISFDEEDGDGIYDATRDGYSIVRNEGGGGGSYRRRFPESTATYGGSGLTGDEQEEIRAVLQDSPDPFIQSLLLPDRRGRMRPISDKQWKILKDRADKKKKLSARPSGFTSTARSGGTIAPGGRPTGKDIDITPADIADEATFKQMVDKAMFDGNVIRFNYNGKERQIIPVNIEKNQKTGKLNMTGQGLDGVRKLFSFDKIEPPTERSGSLSSGRRGMSSGLKFEPTGDAYKRIDANNESSLRDAALQVTEIEDPKIEKMIGDFPTDEIRDYQLAQLEHALKVREDIAIALSQKYPNTVRDDIATVYDYGDFFGGPLSEDAIYDLDTLNDFINSISDEINMFEDIHDRKSDELEETYDLVSSTSRGLESAKLELESSKMDLDEGDIELDEYTKLVEEINSRIDELSQQLEEYEDNAEELKDEVREAGFFGDGEMRSRARALENSYMNFNSAGSPRNTRRTSLASGRREMMQDTIAADETNAVRESLLDADMKETDRMYSSFMSRPSSERASAFASYRRETGKSPNPNDPSFRRYVAGLESDLIMREDNEGMSERDSGRGLSSGSKRKKE